MQNYQRVVGVVRQEEAVGEKEEAGNAVGEEEAGKAGGRVSNHTSTGNSGHESVFLCSS